MGRKGHAVAIEDLVDNIHEGPVVTKRILPETYINENRKYNCGHYNQCLMEVAMSKHATTFLCGNCTKYTGSTKEEGKVLEFVKMTKAEPDIIPDIPEVEPAEQYEEYSDETHGVQAQLFEFEKPYTLENVNVKNIDVDVEMVKKAYNNLLVSMSLLGPLQTVILKKKENGYTVCAGKRRVLAAKEINRGTIPAMVFEANVPDSMIYLYVTAENMNRSANPAMEAEALGSIMSSYGWNLKETSKKLGIPVNQIKSRLKLLSLIPEHMVGLKEGRIKASTAVRLAALSPEKQKELLGKEKITLKEIEDAGKAVKLDALKGLLEYIKTPETNPIFIAKTKLEEAISAASPKSPRGLLKEALALIEQYIASEVGK